MARTAISRFRFSWPGQAGPSTQLACDAPLVGAVAALLLLAAARTVAATEIPPAIAVPNGTVLLRAHAEGAQIYECRAGQDGKLLWQFREPIATLIQDGNTIGRHFAGPTWELADGSALVGRVAAKAPGAGASDIAWLKLDVIDRRGGGVLKDATAVQRIDTRGGNVEGPCATPGIMRAEPYAADYLFLR